MDIATGLGFVLGIGVVVLLMTMDGSASAFISEHAMIVIFGGCAARVSCRYKIRVHDAFV